MPNITVPRSEMPQIAGEDIPLLLVYLGDLRISISAGVMDPTSMAVHQDVNWDKAAVIAQHPLLMRKPVLLTQEPAIIDGNHRHAAHLIAKSPKMGFIKLGTNFEHAIVLLNSFPFSLNVD